VKPRERGIEKPVATTGAFARLRGFLGERGGIAPATVLFFLPVLVLASLAPASASAATCSGLPPAGSSCIFAGPQAGSGAGQVNAPIAVAVDQSTGIVFVGEGNNLRISAFQEDGHFVGAFGFGVLDGVSKELQTCTATCTQGLESFAPGAVNRPTSVAVDDDPSSSAFHDIYTFSVHGFRVQRYSPAGKFDLMFGKDVNQTKKTSVCSQVEIETEGVVCAAGTRGTGEGEFDGEDPIVVDASGDVWLGDVNRLEEFSSEGALLAEVNLPGAGESHSLAVDASGDFYLIGSGASGIQKLSPSGVLLETLDASGHPNALALDPTTGDLFVSDQIEPGSANGRATLLEFDSSGAQTEAFGAGEVIGGPLGNALAFGHGAGRLYVVSDSSGENSAAQIFAVPPPGPIVLAATTKVSEASKTTATLGATINPEGAATTFHFQYITEKQFREDGETYGAGTVATSESASIGEDFRADEISQAITGLVPNTNYRFRVVATNPNAPLGGIDGESLPLTTLPPAAIDSTSVVEVSSTSATLQAQINPLGDATSYRFEYITEAGFQANGESWIGPDQPIVVPQPDSPIGSGDDDVGASQHVQGLVADTVYRYRAVAVNAVAPAGFAGTEETFRTQRPGASLLLPDGRAWELVSQPDKHGALLLPIGETGVIQASSSGDAITYLASIPTEEDPKGFFEGVQVISNRGASSWASKDVSLPHATPVSLNLAYGYEYRAFSSDLSVALLEPLGEYTSLAPEASPPDTERTPYARHDVTCPASPESCFEPLVTGAPGESDVPESAEFGGSPSNFEGAVNFVGASSDLAHVTLSSKVQLTETTTGTKTELYEWAAGRPPAERLQLVSVLPGSAQPSSGSPELGFASEIVRNAVSADGSRVVWSESAGEHHLYVRDTAKAQTVRLDLPEPGCGACAGGDPAPRFQTASSDGSKVFFTDEQRLTANSDASGGHPDLFECQMVAVEEGGQEKQRCELTDLTPPSGSGESASVQGAVLGASENGTSVYYVANAALGGRATRGSCDPANLGAQGTTCNLYLSTYDGVNWQAPRPVAVLSGEDWADWTGSGGSNLGHLTARASPDGGWLAFMSDRSLTGYDSRDALSGKPDQEVYLYDAASGKLTCASCNSTGARPTGVEYKALNGKLVGGVQVWSDSQWLAGNVPGWTDYGASVALHQPRYLADGGRLFFNSSDALVPQDINHNQDVYEYEPEGAGPEAARCGPGVPTGRLVYRDPRPFEAEGGKSEEPAGCVGLVSSGTAAGESAFLDASETGDDVFFLAGERLAPQDVDTGYDVYDAHVCGTGGFPCATAAVDTPPCTSAEACRAAPTPQPSIFGAPSSETFSGAGNTTPIIPRVIKQKAKTLTRAQKLSAALKVCKKHKTRSTRKRCEAAARKKYGATKHARKSNNDRRIK
jgi:WD40-like Beta Propeller Repeat